MTRTEKAKMLIEWFSNLEFEEGVNRTWIDKYFKENYDILQSSEETSPEWTSAYMELYNLKLAILEG